MSGSVDSRILSMKIDNQSFLTGITASINALTNLRNALNFNGANKSLNDIQAAGSRFNLGGMSAGVEGVSAKFLALGTVAVTTLANITNRAVNAGMAFARSFTVAPILDGLHEYETNLQSIQTIQANTGASLQKVNDTLDQLNHYSDQTIYNFSEMAKNIGTFTAAGVDLKTSASSIKGIANLAALSGSNSQQAATAMYQLSQAIAGGKVGLQDWNSVVNAGMGGKKFQNALAQTAVAMGELNGNAVKMVGPMKKLTIQGKSFRESISAKPGSNAWLSSDVLVNTLATLDGRFSKAAMAANGYSKAEGAAKIAAARRALEQKNGVKFTDEQFKGLMKTSDAAFKAATEVKTLGQAFDVAKETVGSGWAQSFRSIFGNFEEAKSTFTDFSNFLNGMINRQARARQVILDGWRNMGGREVLLAGFKQAWTALNSVISPIKNAFHSIFPKATAGDLKRITDGFKALMDRLTPAPRTVANIFWTFKGLFAVFHIGITVVKAIFGVIGDLFGLINSSSGTGGILGFTASIGKMLANFDEAVQKGTALTSFFKTLTTVLGLPIKLIFALGEGLRKAFDGFDISGVLSKIAEGVDLLGEALISGLSNLNFDGVSSALGAGLLGGVFVVVRKLSKGLSGMGEGLVGNITAPFRALTDSMKAMQTQIQAKTLMLIAGAIGILTASVVALSLIDSGKLTKALGAMSIGFGQLLAAMFVLVKISGTAGFVKVPLIAASMVLLASSVLILTSAIALMGQLKWETILKGMAGVAGSLGILALAIKVMPEKKMALTAAGLALIGVALGEIAAAMAIMSLLSWEDIAQGLVGLGGALAIIAGAVQLMGPSLAITGPGLIAVGVALGLIAGTMKIFATMGWEEIGKSMVALAGSMTILSVGLNSMLLALPGAAAMLIVSPALLALGATIKILSKLSWEEIGKSMVALAGGLAILSIALNSMTLALPGAAALLVVSPALLALSAVLTTLGSMSWGSIVKGLVSLGGALAVIGIAGALMAPIVLPLIGLGVAMTAIGAGFALAGVGALAFATAFGIFVAAGTAGLAVIGSLIGMIPEFVEGIAKGIIAFAVEIGKGIGPIVESFTKLVVSMIAAGIRLLPRVGAFFLQLINTGLNVLTVSTPRIVVAGFNFIMALLSGMQKNIPKIVGKAVAIIIAFVTAIGNNTYRVANAAAKAVVKFLDGLTKAIDRNAEEIGRAGGDLAIAIVRGIVNGIKSAGHQIWDELKKHIPSPGDIVGNVVGGLGKAAGNLIPGGRQASEDVNAAGRYGANVGLAVANSYQRSINSASNLISAEMNTNPVIKPVLDLSNIQRDASLIGSVLDKNKFAAEVSASQATSISNDQALIDQMKSAVSEATAAPVELKYEQNNYSPKALSPAEIYRNTRNLLSLQKEALKA